MLTYFRNVFVINHDADGARLQRVSRRLTALGIGFERFAAVGVSGGPAAKTPSVQAGHWACAKSHRALLQKILDRGLDRALIFEDDVILRDDVRSWMERLTPQLKETRWDLFYLGLHLMEAGPRVSENLAVVQTGFHTHAYAVRRRCIPAMLRYLDFVLEHREGVFDGFPVPNVVKLYCDPILAVQEPCFSHTTGTWLDRLPQYFEKFDRAEFLVHCEELKEIEAKKAQAGSSAPEQPPAPEESGDLVQSVLREGLALHKAGKLAEAGERYQKVLAADPSCADALHYFGLLEAKLRRKESALDYLLRATALAPQRPEFYNNFGTVLADFGRHEDALELFDEAVRLRPHYAEAFENRGRALQTLGRAAEAAESWKQSVALRPTNADAHGGLGFSLLRAGNAAAAVEHLREALRLHPQWVEGYLPLGTAYREHGDLDAAIATFHQAIAAKPDAAEGYINLGAALYEAGDPHGSITQLRQAVRLNPRSVMAHWNLAISLLAAGEFREGWLEYEWRRHLPADKVAQKGRHPQPEWSGSDLEGRSILLTSEQGLGDTIQFVRFAKAIKAQGARVVLECQPRLKELLECLPFVDQIVGKGEPCPLTDVQARLVSLPCILNLRERSLRSDPYIEPNADRVQFWKGELSKLRGFKIGIAWQGNKGYGNDSARSIPLKHFATLASIPGVTLVSLQKGLGSDQLAEFKDVVVELIPALDEGKSAFVDTAAVMLLLDLVITSDTSIAHLAGAMGVPVWVALSTSCDWRWLRDRLDTPWYRSMRLFRQNARGEWYPVFERMAEAVRQQCLSAGAQVDGAVLAPMSLGNLIDRITILRIKTTKLRDPSQVKTAGRELRALEAIRERRGEESAEVTAIECDLQAANQRLWDIEDGVRTCEARREFGADFVELARSVYRVNDERAALKRLIDEADGSPLVDFKQYAMATA